MPASTAFDLTSRFEQHTYGVAPNVCAGERRLHSPGTFDALYSAEAIIAGGGKAVDELVLSNFAD